LELETGQTSVFIHGFGLEHRLSQFFYVKDSLEKTSLSGGIRTLPFLANSFFDSRSISIFRILGCH
jgi:hypothetical protein